MSEMFLTKEELVQLTGHKRSDAQVKSLNFMGINHKTRRDGTVVVLRAHAEALLGLKTPKEKIRTAESQMNWDALNK